MKDSKYKITNTTVKPPRLDPRTKKDLRTTTEKVGHAVTFTDNSGRKHTLYQHKPTIVAEINQGILNLKDGGFVKIEKVDDISDILKPHAMKTHAAVKPQSETSPMPQLDFGGHRDADTIEETPDLGNPASNHGSSRRAHAVEMGNSGKGVDTTESDAINPDGKPNFAVTAKHNAKSSRRG